MGEYEVEYEEEEVIVRGHPETEGDFEYENQKRKE